jgi:hypothetical protein
MPSSPLCRLPRRHRRGIVVRPGEPGQPSQREPAHPYATPRRRCCVPSAIGGRVLSSAQVAHRISLPSAASPPHVDPQRSQSRELLLIGPQNGHCYANQTAVRLRATFGA